MKAQEKHDSSSWFGMPRWLALFFGVVAIAGVGFLLWLSAQAFSQSSTLDARRVRALNIAADYIAKWPAVATTIAQTSLYHRSRNDALKAADNGSTYYAYLYHPEFGDFQVKYARGPNKCETKVEIDKNRLTVEGEALGISKDLPEPEMTYIQRARNASWVPPGKEENRICFIIANLDLKKVAPQLGSFSHLLLIKEPRKSDGKSPAAQQQDTNSEANWRDGRVVAWVGKSELPIKRLSDLPALELEVSKVAATAARTYLDPKMQAAGQGAEHGKRDALEPFDSRVAGKDYRFYWRPIIFDLPGEAADPAQEPDSYYLVAVSPSRIAPEPGRARTEVAAFALALFMLIALMPVVKLALLGPVDSMKAIEVAAICLGIVAAAALGTALWTGVRDVLVARTAASTRVARAAARLVGTIDKELHDTLLSFEMDRISQGLGKGGSDKLVAGFAPVIAVTSVPKISRVENLVLLDANGRQAAGTVMNAARDHVGANFDLGDRVYFRRAMDEDFAPASDQLAKELSKRSACTIWKGIEEGLVFEQIRSRTDGAPKTIVAAKLHQPAHGLTDCSSKRTDSTGKNVRLEPNVVVGAFVMPSMLVPTMDSGIRYAVVDVTPDAVGHPVLFHSDSHRANVEQFDESLSAPTRARLFSEIGGPVPCGSAYNSMVKLPKVFTGIYEEEATLLAAARVPCTDWAVIAFKSRRLVDAQAEKPAVHAISAWASLTILPYFLWMMAAVLWGKRAWVWLWPEPTKAKKDAYLTLALLLGGAAILAIVLVQSGAPFKGFLISAVSALAAFGWLAWVHYGQEKAEQRTKEPLDDASEAPDDLGNSLDVTTERRFSAFTVMLLLLVSVMPIAALSADARAYFAQTSVVDQLAAKQAAEHDRIELRSKIARMEGIKTLPVKITPETKVDCPSCPHRFTEHLRRAAGYDHKLLPLPAEPTHWLVGATHLEFADRFTLFSLALIITLILVLAIWTSFWGLFGFGVSIEAVEYPRLPVVQITKTWWLLKEWMLPPRFLVIRAGDHHLKAMQENAVEMDLNDDISNKRELTVPARNPARPSLLLIRNLGLLLGDPGSRQEALRRFEQILIRQGDPPGFRVAILTSLTPLERLLQSFERERDENDELGEEQKTKARLDRAKHREDMRWSAVFEQFTTYFHAARPRAAPPGLEWEGDVVKRIWRELEYVPDPVVAAMIWDPKTPLLEQEILTWARNTARKTNQPRAVIDHLASNLIEHYHLMWSLSSRAERLLLYRIAHGHVPNIAKAYALRSLVKRGLIVLDPYPRTMNKSFAQFVRHVEKPGTIKNWRRTQEHGFWDAARLPFVLAMPLAVGVLVVATIRSGGSLAAIIPLVVAAGPALINALSSARRTAAA